MIDPIPRRGGKEARAMSVTADWRIEAKGQARFCKKGNADNKTHRP